MWPTSLEAVICALTPDGCAPQRCLRWAEGPAWSGSGQYLVFSDIPNNRQVRWLEEDGHVSIFPSPSGFSNGNTFDWDGRQLSCEHLNRRVVRYEHDGKVTVWGDPLW